jgi:hypothetical protein
MVRDRMPARAIRGGVLTYVLAVVGVLAVIPFTSMRAQGHVHPPASASASAPAPAHPPAHSHAHRASIVRLTALNAEQLPSNSIRVLVWTTGSAKVGVGAADPTPLTDTLRLSSLPAITADVSEGDVHVRLLSPGRMRLGGDVSGGRVVRFTAVGRHVVVLKGGVGADTVTDP